MSSRCPSVYLRLWWCFMASKNLGGEPNDSRGSFWGHMYFCGIFELLSVNWWNLFQTRTWKENSYSRKYQVNLSLPWVAPTSKLLRVTHTANKHRKYLPLGLQGDGQANTTTTTTSSSSSSSSSPASSSALPSSVAPSQPQVLQSAPCQSPCPVVVEDPALLTSERSTRRKCGTERC